MREALLVLNIGSSTIKFGVYRRDTAPLARGVVEAVGRAPRLNARLGVETLAGLPAPDPGMDTHALTLWLLDELDRRIGPLAIAAAGHRVVHGGQRHAAPVELTPDVIAELEALSLLAPGHQPYNLAGIRAVGGRWPGVRQVACFDTAFHRARPRLAQLYALPREMADEGFIRYGFHGLSYEYIAGRLPEVIGERAEGRVIVAHLGSGASLCAMKGRRSVDTTMGFSALDGLMMGTRAGQIDPGVLLHLMRTRGFDAEKLETLLGRKSGLLGVSGISPDMRDLAGSDDPRAAEAVALFIASVTRHVGALAASLGGLDALVFTAGIGEHSPQIRLGVMQALAWIGLKPDIAANAAGATIVTRASSRVTAAVIPTDEEAVILNAIAG